MKPHAIPRMTLLGISICLIFPLSPLSAQKPLELEDIQCKFSHGDHPGLSLTIPETQYDDIAKAWTKKMEKGTKSDIAIENGEYSIFGAQLPEISENPVNVYSILRAKDSAIVLDVSIELKPKEFAAKSQSEKEYALFRDYLYQFGKEEYTSVADNQQKEEEKKLKMLEKELTSLNNAKTRLEKDIVSENANILEFEDKIALLKTDASNLNDQIGQEKTLLIGLKDEEAKKAKEEQIKDLEKDKKSILKDIENFQKRIVDSKSAIHKAELDIESNVNEQLAKTGEIDAQKVVVQAASTKLNTIMGY